MISLVSRNIEKKYRFALHAFFYGVILYSYIDGLIPFEDWLMYVAIISVTSLSVFLVHYPNVNYKNMFMAVLLPVTLALGGTLSMIMYPNISPVFKLITIVGFSILDYVVLLIDNIFLVIEDREELIPLYRVAVTWSLILQIVVFIPLVSSIYKFNTNSFIQAGIVGIISFLYTLYQIWATRYDKDAKNVGVVERIFLSFVVGLILVSAVLGVSFVPSESFLKALYTSTVAMFGLSYIGAYLKNEINKRFIFQYSFIILFFLVLMLVYRP